MNQDTGRHNTHPLVMVMVVVGFLVLIPVLVIAMASSDPLWFKPGFQELPGRVIVYHEGQKTEYHFGIEGYDAIARAVQQTLDGGVAHASGIGLSDASLQDAYNKYLTVEAIFDRPVKLHASFNTHNPTQMLFLINGRHTEFPIVLMGVNGHYLSNPPILKTNDPLRNALKALGYSVKEAGSQ